MLCHVCGTLHQFDREIKAEITSDATHIHDHCVKDHPRLGMCVEEMVERDGLDGVAIKLVKLYKNVLLVL